MSFEWQDFLKATMLHELFVKQNKPYPALKNVGAPVRMLAACSGELAPWELTGDAVQLAYNVALALGESGKQGLNLAMVVRTLVDGQHLADRSPLTGSCKPYASEEALGAQARTDRQRTKMNRRHRTDSMRTELSQRKRDSRLPAERAFWELVRIVFTEAPRSVADAVRFSQVELAIVTGFRAGENAIVPVDWPRWREYMESGDRPAGERGGISRSLMIRHFAEKQAEDEGADGIVLFKTAQHVPPMFEELVLEALGAAERLTALLRRRLRRQTETGRLLPEFEPGALVPAWDLYNRVSGAVRLAEEPPPEALVARYRSGHDLAVLDKIRAQQIARLSEGAINRSISKYWWHHASREAIVLRNRRGEALVDRVPD